MASGIALIPVARASDLEAEARKRSDAMQVTPVIQELAAHVRTRWDSARIAKRKLEERMLQCLRQRNGEYDPDKLSEIKSQGGSDIFVNLTSVKCRAATSWLRDTLLGSGADKPWSIETTPIPDLPPEVTQGMMNAMAQQIQTMMMQGQQMPDENTLRDIAGQMKDEAMRKLKEEAETRMDRMERKMEDQLDEGGWTQAFNEFLDDIVTFPYAVMKGPIKRKRKTLQWANGKLMPTEIIRNEWERVDPFYLYWAPWAWELNDGYVIERHRMTADDLQALIGVPGYNDDAIRTVLNDFGTEGMKQWLWTDASKAQAEGKYVTEAIISGDLVDAIQLWDSVKGSLLLEWGLTEKEIPDAALTYPCEVWLIGSVVIRAVLNYDPLGRKPYYLTSYENTPGAVDGKGVTDLCRDAQSMVNASGRALANNMGISSGPQVGVNISRLPPGEDITDLHPWKIWQFQASDYGDSSAPITFFQPQSNANELMAVFEKFSARADEDTMIPRYMTGENTPGAGRTSSGLSMLISNAGKGIKQVISNIDQNVIVPAIERLYQDNLRYSQDPDLVGDVNIIAKGATSLVIKESEAVRRNEFLQMVLNSPMAQQIVGMDGAAELLRDSARNLTGNVDRIVPDRNQLSTMQQQQQMIQQLQEQIAQLTGIGPDGKPIPQAPGMTQGPAPKNMLPDGSQVGGREGNMMSPRPNGV
jgi:methyl coenzyme M reductase subunit D